MSFLDDEAEQEKLDGPAQSVFTEIMRVARALDKLDIDIDIKTQELAQLTAQKRQMEEITLPSIMQQNHIDDIGLDNGRRLVLKEAVNVRVPENDVGRKIMLDFLFDNGGGHLIKDALTVTDAPESIKDALREQEITFEEKKTVNTNSLVAWTKGVLGLKKGSMQTVSQDAFPKEASLFIYKKATIVTEKK